MDIEGKRTFNGDGNFCDRTLGRSSGLELVNRRTRRSESRGVIGGRKDGTVFRTTLIDQNNTSLSLVVKPRYCDGDTGKKLPFGRFLPFSGVVAIFP